MKGVKYIPGDLVTRKDKPNMVCRVIGISSSATDDDILYSVEVLEDNSNMIYFWGSQLTPIKLTPAILEANGFKKGKFGDYYIIANNPTLTIYLEKENNGKNLIITLGGATLIHCNFVHQLQHLLFGLGLNP